MAGNMEKKQNVSLSAEDRNHPSSSAPRMSYGILQASEDITSALE
jgi:hypothetical protein